MAESTYTAPATYTITFPSLSQAEVKVSIDGVLQSSGFTISGYSTSGSGTVSFTSAPTVGATVRIFRDTTILNNQAPAPKADFQSGASIQSADLNNNMDQVLYKLAEKVDEGDISNDAVVTQAIRDLNVTTDKINNGAVTATKLATNAVEETQILAGAVTSAKILDGSVTSAKILNGTIVNDDINASAAIDGTKINTDFGSQTIATTGNITVTGTVDGRDVSTDGTKLDGIEANATADQTAAEIRTLVDSATDSNVFTDSEKTKLTSISAGADVTSTNSINALTDVNTSGITDGQILKYQASSSSFIAAEDDGSTAASTAAANTANTALSRVNTYLHDGTNAVGDGVGSNPQGLAYALTRADSATTAISTYLHDGTNPSGDGLGGNPQGLAYAINQANTAISTSNAASSLVSSAVFYTLIANFAAFPSSPSNQDRIEVADSSGLESQSIVAGLPSGFTGSSDLIVRLQYNSSTSKWDFLQYFAADPENRYLTQSLPVVKGDSTNGSGQLTLNCENNSHGIKIKGPPHSAAATYTLTLPNDTGTSGQALKTDGSGVLSFADVSSSFITQTDFAYAPVSNEITFNDPGNSATAAFGFNTVPTNGNFTYSTLDSSIVAIMNGLSVGDTVNIDWLLTNGNTISQNGVAVLTTASSTVVGAGISVVVFSNNMYYGHGNVTSVKLISTAIINGVKPIANNQVLRYKTATSKWTVDDAETIAICDGGNFANGSSLVSTSTTFDGGSF